MNRAEHMRWAKDRALAYVDQRDIYNAKASMISDLGKHPSTTDLVGFALVSSSVVCDLAAARAWIEGFAE